MARFDEAKDVPELSQGRLLDLVYRLLNEDREKQLKIKGPKPTVWDPERENAVDAGFSYAFNNGWAPGTMTSSLSTNAVMRT